MKSGAVQVWGCDGCCHLQSDQHSSVAYPIAGVQASRRHGLPADGCRALHRIRARPSARARVYLSLPVVRVLHPNDRVICWQSAGSLQASAGGPEVCCGGGAGGRMLWTERMPVDASGWRRMGAVDGWISSTPYRLYPLGPNNSNTAPHTEQYIFWSSHTRERGTTATGTCCSFDQTGRTDSPLDMDSVLRGRRPVAAAPGIHILLEAGSDYRYASPCCVLPTRYIRLGTPSGPPWAGPLLASSALSFSWVGCSVGIWPSNWAIGFRHAWGELHARG